MNRRITAAIACVGATAAGGGILLSPASSAPAEQGPLYGVLLGANEVAPDGKRGAGDPDGRSSASAIIDEGKLCFGLTVKNIGKPTAAHIHRGVPGTNGPPVVTLTAPAKGDPGASSGCVAITRSLAKAIINNPQRFYWNVHTESFGGGAVRGQLFRRTK